MSLLHRFLPGGLLACITFGFFVQPTLAALIPFDGEEVVPELKLNAEAAPKSDVIAEDIAEMEALEDDKTGEVYWQVMVKQPDPKHPYRINLQFSNADEIEEGTPILIRYTLDGQGADGGAAEVRAKVQLNESPWPTLAGDKSIPLSMKPQTFDLALSAPQDLDPKKISFLLQMGGKAQTINVRSIKAYAGDNIPEVTAPEGEEAYAFDFEDKFLPVQPPAETKSKITGAIPAGFTEDTHWADVDVNYKRLDAMNFNGEGTLSVEVDEVRQGYAMLRLDNFKASSDHFLKIKCAVKSPTNSSFILAIRKSTNPFTKYWKVNVGASPEWGVKEFLVPPLPEDGTAQLVMEFQRPGTYDIDDFTITTLPKDQVESAQSIEGNLLLNSSFPFGYQRPWSQNSGEYRYGDYVSDPENPGPTKTPSLKIVGDGAHQILRMPFKGKPGSVHSVSFWAKAKTPGTIFTSRIGPPSEKLWVGDWGGNFELTDKWKRYFHKVKLPYHADGFYIMELYMRNNDVVWLDGVSVKVGDRVGNFERAADLELTLIPPDRKNFYHLYFPDETFGLNVGVLGDIPEGAQLKVDITPYMYTGYEGKNSFTQKLQPNEQDIIELRWKPDQLDLPEFGTYWVRVQALDANGTPLSKLAETVMHRIRVPRSWGKMNVASPFGTHVSADGAMVAVAKRLGFNWVRSFQMGWVDVQPNPGDPYDWSRLDDLVGWYKENHLAVLGIYGHPPNWANMTALTKQKTGWRDRTHAVNDDHIEAWADYAATMSKRYEDTIKTYETWNEPFLASFFTDGKREDGTFIHSQPERLYRMTKAVYERLKKDEIDVQLAWNIGPHYTEEAEFDNQCAEIGMFKYVDLVAYHSYERSLGGYPGDRYEDMINITKAFLAKYGQANMPIWNSEGGPGGGHTHNILPTMPIADMTGLEERYSQYLIRAWNSMLANGVAKYFLYHLNNGGFWRGDYDLMQPSGDIAPNSIAFSNLAWHIENKKFVEVIPLAETFHAYVYANETDVAVSFVPRAVGTLNLPDNVKEGWSFTDLYGNKTKGEQTRDFWLYAEGAKAADVVAWLKEQYPPAVAAK